MRTRCTGARSDSCCLLSRGTGGAGSLQFPGRVTQLRYLMQRGHFLSQCLAVLLDVQCWFVFTLVLRSSCSGIMGIGSPAGSRCPFVSVAWLPLSPWAPPSAHLAQSPQWGLWERSYLTPGFLSLKLFICTSSYYVF